ncbi:MAG: Kelch repeat type 1-containing protein [Acidimicrobiales bacterium]|nr:Kelch repeat type 1-containing protein [Acidimicrobiales bacterium]
MLLSRSKRWGAALAAAVTGASAIASCSADHAGSNAPPASTRPASAQAAGASTTGGPAATTTTAPPAVLRAAIVGPALPQNLSRAVAVADGGGVLVLGGRTAAKVSTDEVVRWSPGGSAAVTGRLAHRVHDAAGVLLGGRALLFGGGDRGSVADVQEVTTAGAGSQLGRLPEARSDVSAAVLGDTAYVIGGFDDTNGTPRVLATKDGHTFTTVATLPREVRYGAVVALGGRLLLFGGEDQQGPTSAVLAIDPAAGTVQQVAALPQPLSHAVAFVLNGVAYVAGGETGTTRHAEIWRFDPTTSTLVAGGSLPDARSDAAVAVAGPTAYLVGGETPNAVTSVVAVSAG